MKVIIFGITGQDGSYLAELLLEKGYEVVGVTRRVSVDTLQRIHHILPQIHIIEGDITDAFNVGNIIKEYEPDQIYNLAAQSHVGTSFSQPSLTWDVTAGGTMNVLEGIRYSGRKDKIKFYQASSSEMFGKNYDTNVHSGKIGKMSRYQDENTTFVPQSPYAIAKLASHHLVRNYREAYGIFGCSGILFNHESERRGEKFVTRKITKWIGEFIAWTEDKDISPDKLATVDADEVYIPGRTDVAQGFQFPKLRLGNIEARRDWGHAKDYVEAMNLMLEQKKPDDYVVATGHTYSVEEFLEVAFGFVGIEDWENYIVIDPEFYRAAEVDYLLGCSDKARTKLGWRPKISFKQLAETMVDHDVKEARLRRPSIQTI
tara:strand:- start:6609 stop:7727 length:1119 start_codon:yes stop_codon:yes gene_type:complete